MTLVHLDGLVRLHDLGGSDQSRLLQILAVTEKENKLNLEKIKIFFS